MLEPQDTKHPIKETKAAAMERKASKETKGKNTPFSAKWKASLNPISFLNPIILLLFLNFFPLVS